MKIHPVAELFPMLSDSELQELADDIKTNGLHQPIVMQDDVLLDGRNRLAACELVGVEPTFTEYEGTDLFSFIIGSNLHRRHLTVGQRAVIALELKPLYEQQAKERMTAGINQYSPVESLPQAEKGKSRDIAAEQVKVSGRTVDEVKKIKDESPEFFQKIKDGEMSVHEAKKEIQKEKIQANHSEKRARVLPEGKFQVIYADPPWKYDNSGFNESAESQYPTMPVEEICNLPIEDLTSETSILFLWATNPLLQEALQVLEAWGFEYKTNMAWIKDAGRGKGWFLKSKHELLLIGVKENTPHPVERLDSCFEADRGPVHSRKPEKVYQMIESMYPEGKKIELFARNKREGWDAWGNEEI